MKLGLVTESRITLLYLYCNYITPELIDVCEHVSAVGGHEMSHFKFCKHFNPNLYEAIYYILFLLHAYFSVGLHSQTQNAFNEVCLIHQLFFMHSMHSGGKTSTANTDNFTRCCDLFRGAHHPTDVPYWYSTTSYNR